jgi:hypothetical protein
VAKRVQLRIVFLVIGVALAAWASGHAIGEDGGRYVRLRMTPEQMKSVRSALQTAGLVKLVLTPEQSAQLRATTGAQIEWVSVEDEPEPSHVDECGGVSNLALLDDDELRVSIDWICKSCLDRH